MELLNSIHCNYLVTCSALLHWVVVVRCYLFVIFFCFYSGKKITTCCLSKLTGHFYIGTDGGNVYTLDVRLFELKDKDAILWEKATGL